MDELYLGPTPTDEECAQVGTDDYQDRARKECRAYRNQLLRMFGQPKEGCKFWIKANPHEFGTYYEVVIQFDERSEEAIDFALNVEGNLPYRWDKEAIEELNAVNGHV